METSESSHPKCGPNPVPRAFAVASFAAKRAAKKGLVIYTIGVGSESGEPLPLLDNKGNMRGYKKDKEGQIVLSRINTEPLQKIAEAGGGKFYLSSNAELVVDKIYQDISRRDQRSVAKQSFSRYKEQYQIPLAIAVGLFILSWVLPNTRSRSTEWKGRI